MTIVTDQKKWNYMVLVWKIKIIGKKKKSDLNLHIGRRNKKITINRHVNMISIDSSICELFKVCHFMSH